MQMRDQRDVRLAGAGRRQVPAPAAQVREPACEQRIGEHAYVRVLDRASGVTPPGDLHRHFFAPFARLPEAYVQE
ncbi:hypothetical protein GCM10010255_07660 [Streptomyces coeruleofuscus]|uniref:Uncharacterized protein n=1 Tax=Streptomyces coeruleofuscus TaxID=66879 RepID=A0ABP5ULP8_9ACTN